MKEMIDFSVKNVFSTLYICWGAQAALYHRYQVPKHALPNKMFGVFKHSINNRTEKLFRGFDDEFYAPHSRHTEIRHDDVAAIADLEILSESPQSGLFVLASRDRRQIYSTGHLEYDAGTLGDEYRRDVGRGLEIAVPCNYYPGDNPAHSPLVKWRAHGHLFFSNWLNYYVYQETPYEINRVGE